MDPAVDLDGMMTISLSRIYNLPEQRSLKNYLVNRSSFNVLRNSIDIFTNGGKKPVK
jgi:hypothetical protein